MSVIGSNVLAGASGQAGGGAGGFAISRSLRFNSGDSSYLSRQPSATGNRKTWTWSSWVKRSKLGTDQTLFSADQASGTWFIFQFDTSDRLMINWTAGTGGAYQVTTAKFRDPSAWYHLVLAFDTTQSTDTDKIKLYVNGVLFEERDVVGYPSTNTDYQVNNGNKLHKIGTGAHNVDLYLAEVNFIDGQALAPTDFGETNTDNLWVPIAYAGTYGPLVDQSRTWSNDVTGTADSGYPVTNGFDNNLTTKTGGNLTFTPPSPIACTKVRITMTVYAAPANTIYLNGVDIASQIPVSGSNYFGVPVEFTPSNNQFVSYQCGAGGDEPGWFNKIELLINGSYVALLDPGVSVTSNGFRLEFADNSSNAALGTDTSGVSPANTWTVNNLTAASNNWPNYVYAGGATYSSTETGKNFYTGNGADLFDGTTSNYVGGANVVGGTVYFRPAAAITGVTSIQLYGAYNGETRINGSVVTVSPAWGTSDQYVTIQSPPSSITEISIKGDLAYSAAARIKAIKVNGAMLVDLGPSHVDSLRDSPTNGTQSDTGAGGEVVGNYATWNPLVQSSSTFSNGNLQVTTSGGSGYPLDMANFYTPAGTGKWYWEFELDALSGSNYTMVGMLPRDSDYQQGVSNIPKEKGGISIYIGYNGDVETASGAATLGTDTATFGVGDILGWAFDAENGTLQCYKNGVSQGTQFTNIRTDVGWVFCVTDYDNSATATYVINFGQRSFHTAAPAGFLSLNTANLPEPTIADGSQYFDTKLYTANASTQSISGYNFSPAFVLVQSRANAYGNEFYDIVRGVNKRLYSNSTAAELVAANQLTSFDSNGFTLGSASSSNYNSGTASVGWAWDAGSSNTTIAAGSLNSSVYNQSQTWSGQVSGTAYSSTYPKTLVFDGSPLAGNPCIPANGTQLTFTPSPSFSNATSVKIYYYYPTAHADAFVLNGTSVASSLSTGSSVQSHTFDVTGSGFTSLTWSRSLHASEDAGMFGIEVDGKLLVDSGVSLPNVPSIASTVRANPSAGFSIVSYSGSGASNATLGHGLGAEPYFYIVKRRDVADQWRVYHQALGATKFLNITSDGAFTASTIWNNTEPTNSVFSIGSSTSVIASGGTYLALCFSPVEGYSAMGSYQGNGNSSGPFIYTGFKIRWLMVKSSSNSGEHWLILDTARDSYNVADATIYANLNNAEAEASALGIDLLSNGFKPRGTNAGTNASGYTYVYLAFASNPFASNGGLAR